MKRFSLESVLLVSLPEGKAKKIKLHPRRTILLGENHTGKSFILKSIYYTFGAKPPKLPELLKKGDLASLVRFSVDGIAFSLLRQGDLFAIYDVSGNLIRTFKSVTSEMAPFFADLFNFKIKLADRAKNLITPPPAFLFLPFSIDQDSGWTNNWSSFENLGQIPKWRNSIIQYHTGIRPNEWYLTKGTIEKIRDEINMCDAEKGMLNKIRENLREQLVQIQFDIDIESFKQEISELLQECKKLNTIQDNLKTKLADLYNHRIMVETQIKFTEQALNEAHGDYRYSLDKIPDESIECPICGAEYENSFVQRFEIARDEDKCHLLLSQLRRELTKIEGQINAEGEEYSRSIKETEKIRALLERKQGDVTLQDLIESKGKQRIKSVIDERLAETTRLITEKNTQLNDLSDKLKRLENKDLKDKIVGRFDSLMEEFLWNLDASNINRRSYQNITTRITASGSMNPRVILAYNFSILHVINEFSTSTFCPILIDTPNQQGQDELHLKRMLNFIKDKQPQNSQMIVGLENTKGVNFDGDIIELTHKFSVLQENEYDEAFSEIEPYINSAMKAQHDYLF